MDQHEALEYLLHYYCPEVGVYVETSKQGTASVRALSLATPWNTVAFTIDTEYLLLCIIYVGELGNRTVRLWKQRR